jgi:cytochrome c oxidase assembly factor CtaG
MLAWMGAVTALGIALGSPLATLHHELLTAHMAQHILLSLVAAPLFLIGSRPQRPIGPPAMCWVIGVGTLIAWHVPGLFELGVHSPRWHPVEQATFLGSGLLFWWPVLQSGRRTAEWWAPLYLFLAMLPCDALAAFLAFSDRVVYPTYLAAPGALGLSPLQDQECAGALMWFAVTVAYAVPAAIVTIGYLSPLNHPRDTVGGMSCPGARPPV